MNSLKTFAFFTLVACGEKELEPEVQGESQKIELPSETPEEEKANEATEEAQSTGEEASYTPSKSGEFQKAINNLKDDSTIEVTTETFETKE